MNTCHTFSLPGATRAAAVSMIKSEGIGIGTPIVLMSKSEKTAATPYCTKEIQAVHVDASIRSFIVFCIKLR